MVRLALENRRTSHVQKAMPFYFNYEGTLALLADHAEVNHITLDVINAYLAIRCSH